MNKRSLSTIAIALLMLCLSGCWDKPEPRPQPPAQQPQPFVQEEAEVLPYKISDPLAIKAKLNDWLKGPGANTDVVRVITTSSPDIAGTWAHGGSGNVGSEENGLVMIFYKPRK